MTASLERPWGSCLHASTIRLAVLAIWIASIGVTPYGLYARLPEDVVSGFGFWRFLLADDGVRAVLFDPVVLHVLKYAAIALAGAAALSPRLGRWTTPLLFVVVLVLDELTKSVSGFVNHAQAAPLFALGVLACFSRLDYLSLPALFSRALRRVAAERLDPGDGFAVVVWLVSLIVVVPYTYIGLNRLLVGGLDVFTGDALLYYLGTSSRSGAAYPSWIALDHVGWVFKIGFPIITLFEVSASVVLLSERFRLMWLVVMIGFHLTTVVTMNILFWENSVLIAAAFWWGWRGTGRWSEGASRAR